MAGQVKQITSNDYYGLIVRVTKDNDDGKCIVKPLKGQEELVDNGKLKVHPNYLQEINFVPQKPNDPLGPLLESGIVKCYCCGWEFDAINIDVDATNCPICNRPKLDFKSSFTPKKMLNLLKH